MASAIRQVAVGVRIFGQIFVRLLLAFTACFYACGLVVVVMVCKINPLCMGIIVFAPFWAFDVPPDSNESGLSLALPWIWTAAVLATAVWTIVLAKRQKRLADGTKTT